MIIFTIIKLVTIIVNVDSNVKILHMKFSTFEASPFLNMTINNFTFNMKIAGDFNAFNAIAAYAVLKELGLNDASIQKVLKHILQIMDECSTFLKEIKKR